MDTHIIMSIVQVRPKQLQKLMLLVLSVVDEEKKQIVYLVSVLEKLKEFFLSLKTFYQCKTIEVKEGKYNKLDCFYRDSR